MSTSGFTGPLFIVGMPRSGTKLLRDLLNRHPYIAIINNETDFLPYWFKHWPEYGDLSIYNNFYKFYKKMLKIPFFTVRKMQGRMINAEYWYDRCRSYDPAGVFEAFARYETQADIGLKIIWGDKTPGYLKRIGILKSIFPDAKFIHILRDVRDYCLSSNKAWNKNMIRSAQRWVDDIKSAKEENINSNDYIEIRYEDLLDDPEYRLREVCKFLGIDFNPDMLLLTKASEDIGDAKGKRNILKNNQGKYKDQMSSKLQNKIEEISAPLLQELGYPVNNTSHEFKRVSDFKMTYYKMLDGLNILRSNIKRRGHAGILRTLRSFIVSANRN